MIQINPLLKSIIITLIDLLIPKKVNSIGRPVKCDEKTYIDAIFYVLTSGIGWNYIRGYPVTGDAIRKKFIYWSSYNIFKYAYVILVNIYLEFNINVDKLFLDASHIKNIFGKDCVGKNVYDRFRKSTKLSIITDVEGIPISMAVGPGNTHDSKMIKDTLKLFDDIDVTYYDTQYLIADKGYYGSNISEMICNEYKMILVTPDKRTTEEINERKLKVKQINKLNKEIIKETDKLKKYNSNKIVNNINNLVSKKKVIKNRIKKLKQKHKELNKKKRGRKTDKYKLLKDRYVVERTFSWFKKYNRLLNRKDRYISSFESFIFIGASNIVSNKLLDIYDDIHL
jgi:transposase